MVALLGFYPLHDASSTNLKLVKTRRLFRLKKHVKVRLTTASVFLHRHKKRNQYAYGTTSQCQPGEIICSSFVFCVRYSSATQGVFEAEK
jgi:hypothetical protein